MSESNPWGHLHAGTVDVETHLDVPVRTAYDRWSQFESYPRFMKRVRKVEQVRPAVTRWFVGSGPLHSEFYAEVREQHPDSLIAWRTLSHRFPHEGEATFRSVDESSSAMRLTMRMPCPGWMSPRALSAFIRPVITSEVANFKTFVESVGDVGDAWRGTIREGRVTHIEKRPPLYPDWIHG